MIVAVFAALAAGCTFAIGSELQASAAAEAPADAALSWRLIADLIHRPKWLLGITSDVGSFALQALALGFGPLALVQPLLVTGVLFAVPLSVRWRGMRLRRRDWAATVAVSGGLALFLASAAPESGHPQTSTTKWTFILIAIGGLMAVAVAAGKTAQGPYRASLYAVAAGSAFGLMAALTKTCTWLIGQGPGVFFAAWQPYGLAVVASIGAIIQQSAFQAAPLPASLPVMDAVEPTTAVLIGVFAFGESLSGSPLALAGEAAGILALLAGVVVLDRSPAVTSVKLPADGEIPGRDMPSTVVAL